MNTYIQEAEEALLHTYNRYPIVLDRGEGMYLYDIEGKKYLDFCAGIGVFALGYGNREYNEALKGQIDRLIHTSNLYYNAPAIEAAKKLKEASGMDKVFFTNSGTEAVEGALKAARKYAFLKDGCTGHEFIAMEHSFHGRTFGSLSVTGAPKYREAFEPMIGHVRFARLNDMDSVTGLVNDKTCAIILETVQGEGGIHPADRGFLEGIKALCEQKDILLILDEIQCGMGRTGAMFAWQHYGVKPDILTTAKALGGGVPVGAFLLAKRVASASLEAGDHGSTYGGNPLAAAAVDKTLDLFRQKHIIKHTAFAGAYLEKRLDELAARCPFAETRRGLGLMQGLELDRPAAPIIRKALDKGLLLINAGERVIRFLPPLIVEAHHIDEMMGILEDCLT